ncbi:hypothetical protein ACA910_008593 [Epithemia clementina (nom. ined.)]
MSEHGRRLWQQCPLLLRCVIGSVLPSQNLFGSKRHEQDHSCRCIVDDANTSDHLSKRTTGPTIEDHGAIGFCGFQFPSYHKNPISTSASVPSPWRFVQQSLQDQHNWPWGLSTSHCMLPVSSPQRTLMEEGDISRVSNLWASSSSSSSPRTHDDGPTKPNKNETTKSNNDNKSYSYDFVIIGHGNAGHSAMKELQKLCPGATIALIDPVRKVPSTTQPSPALLSTPYSTTIPNLDFFPRMATSIDPRSRIVRLGSNDAKGKSSGEINVKYRYAALIATGSHGAPTPTYLVDKQAWPFVLELRPTMLPQLLTESQHSQTKKMNRKDTSLKNGRKCLEPIESRRLIMEAARRGKNVGILGSGWDAIDLAVACAQASMEGVGSRKRAKGSRGERRTTLFYGATAPVSHMLPQYLSTAVAKRLRSKRVLIQDRTLVRYVSFDDRAGSEGKKMGVYTAKAFDVLDSQRTLLDWLVVAPEVRGLRGNALLPTNRIATQLVGNSDGRPWYQSWSDLSTSQTSPSLVKEEAPMLMCYQEDGRVAVNTELCACSRVYGAGSVARFGNAFSGDADVAGGGAVDSAKAGQVAASNMSSHYFENLIFSFPNSDRNTSRQDPSPLPIQLKDPFPIWRSDVLSYDAETASSLSSVGITALCVGTCDSERYTTHGVWWTNQAAQQRIFRRRMTESDDGESNPTTQTPKGDQLSKAKTSVYGIGVVYYLDRTGRIKGVITWGLPFANIHDRSLKAELVQQIKDILASRNNGFFVPGSTESFSYFSEQTQRLVRTAFSSGRDEEAAARINTENRLDVSSPSDFPRPLHRYTPIWMSRLAFRNRHAQRSTSTGTLRGEELFAPSLHNHSHEISLPTRPVAGVGFSDPSNQAFQASQNMYEYQVWELKETRWELNELLACPPKEDAIWIRKGYEDRNTNVMEQRMEDMVRLLSRKQSVGGGRASVAGASEG